MSKISNNRICAYLLCVCIALLSSIATVYALPNDIPDFYYDLGPMFFEVRELTEYHQPDSVIEVNITTHIIWRKVLKGGYHAFICTPSGDFVTYHELHAGETLPSDYVYPSLDAQSPPPTIPAAPPKTATASQTPVPAVSIDKTGFSGGDSELGRLLGDISRGNHSLSGIADSPIIVPRPAKSKYESIQELDAKGVSLNDISGHWAESDIVRFAESGYIAGYPDGSFKPDDSVSYAEFATIVARFNLQPVRFKGGFSVFRSLHYSNAQEQWFYNAFMIASEAGIFGNDTTLIHKIVDEGQTLYYLDDCNKSASRQHIVLFLANMLQYESANTNLGFHDIADFDPYSNDACKAATAKMTKHGIIQGYSDNTFRPNATITRAELVTILVRLLDLHDWDMGKLHDNLYGNHQKYFWDEEEKLIGLVNAARAGKGIATLVRDKNLVALARIKSIDFLVNDYFDHESPTYGKAIPMANRFGYPYGLSENIVTTYANAEVSHGIWETSTGHYNNYMNSGHKYVGCAIDFGGSVELFDSVNSIRH